MAPSLRSRRRRLAVMGETAQQVLVEEHPPETPWPFLTAISFAMLFPGALFRGPLTADITFGLAPTLVYFPVNPLLIIGLSLFVIGLGGWIYGDATREARRTPRLTHEEWSPLEGVEKRKLGMWFFLASEVMFFSALIGTYVMFRVNTPGWPDPSGTLNINLTAVNTFILIVSSFTMVLAYDSAVKGNQMRLKVFLATTTVLGALFLSIQASEYLALIHEGFLPTSGVFGSGFYALTGIHGAHVTAGTIAMGVTSWKAFKGCYSKDDHRGVEMVGLYWHFVDLVWIILFTVVYLI